MVYAFISIFFVLGVKVVTSLRLRGLKVRLEAIQPEIDRLRTEVAKSEDELSELKLKVEEKEQLFLNLADIVRIYEDSLRNPVDDTRVEERVQLMESGVGESTQV